MRAVAAFLTSIMSLIMVSFPAAAQPGLADYAEPPLIWGGRISPEGSTLALGCTVADVGKQEICFIDMETGQPTGKIGSPEGFRILSFYWINERFLGYVANYTEQLRTTQGYRAIPFYRAYAFDMENRESIALMRDEGQFTNTTDIASLMNGDDETVVMQVGFYRRQDRDSGRSNIRRSSDAVMSSRLFEVNLSSGLSQDMTGRTSIDGLSDHIVSADGEILARAYYEMGRGDYVLAREGDSGNPIYEGRFENGVPVVYGLVDEGNALILDIPDGPDMGLWRVDMMSGERTSLVVDGEVVDRTGTIFDRRRGELVGFNFMDHMLLQRFIDPELDGFQSALQDALQGRVRLLSWTDDRTRFTLTLDKPGEPTAYFYFDARQGRVQPIGNEAPQVAVAGGAVSEPWTFTASDGMEIPAYITYAHGSDPRHSAMPLILMPHGGPEARDDASYDWWAQYYASLGYIVLKPNYRGSSGYGDEFRDAGYNEFGGRMIDDMTDGARQLISEGLARDGGYCVVGASYGGYAALMAAIRSPQDVACAVSVNGVTDPFLILGNARVGGGTAAPSLRYWADYIGTVFDSEERQVSISPLQRLDDLRAPLLLIHGDEDSTVDVEQSRLMDQAMQGRRDFTYVELAGEDHYLGTRSARSRLLEESRDFLAQHHPSSPH